MAALLKLAVRNLMRNRRRTAITLAALVTGVTVMVFLRGFILGQREMLTENVVRGHLGAVQVHKAGYLANVLASPLLLDLADSPELRARLRSAPGVVAVAPRIQFGAMVSTPDKRPPPDDGSALSEAEQGKTSFFLATAIDPAVEGLVTTKRAGLVAQGGEMFRSVDAPGLVLNLDFAAGLQMQVVAPGAPLPPPEAMTALLASDRDSALNGENVVLTGVIPTFSPGDKRTGLVPLGTAQRLLRMEGRVTEYALSVEPLERAPQVKAALQAELGEDYEVSTWEELFPFLKELAGTQDFVFGVVSSIFLVIVLLGVVNAMLMSVLERVREIGTMLAVGMRRAQVVQLFLLEGLTLGLVGGTLGVVLGAAVVAFFHSKGIAMPAPGASVPSMVRPVVSAAFLLQTLAEATLGAALASLWPAWRASALRPVEALASV